MSECVQRIGPQNAPMVTTCTQVMGSKPPVFISDMTGCQNFKLGRRFFDRSSFPGQINSGNLVRWIFAVPNCSRSMAPGCCMNPYV